MLTDLKQKLYAHDPINRERQSEFDIAKAILIFCLALIHCTIECIPEEDLVSGIPYLMDTVIGGPMSAPVFMFCMGIGMVYTHKNTPKQYAHRGLKLCILNYVLNVCRFLIPFLIGYFITGDYEQYIESLFYRVLENDIMMFAGMAMLTIAFFQKLGLSDGWMLGISLAMSLLGTFLTGIDAGTPVVNILLGCLIGTEDAAGMVRSYFPLLNWLIVPVAGYIFGKRLIYVKNKSLFYGLLSTTGLLIAVVYFTVGIIYEFGMFGEGQNCYYHLHTLDALATLCSSVGVFGIYYLILNYLPHWAIRIIESISRNINTTYCIHWIIISFVVNVGLYILHGTQVLSVPMTMLLGTTISVMSILMAYGWTAVKKRYIGGRKA